MTLKDLNQEEEEESPNKHTDEIELNEKHLSLIYDTLSDAIFLLAVEPDDCFRFVSVNQAFFAAIGLTREQVVGKRIEQVLPETAHALVISKYKEAISENKTVFWEQTSTFPTGELMGAVTVTPVCNAEGVCTHLVGSVHDLTEIKHAEKALRESEGKLSAMLQSLGDHMSMMDVDLNILWANDVAKGLFGDDIIGKKCYEVYHGRNKPCEPFPCLILKAFEDGQVHEHETLVQTHAGKTLNYACTASVALRDDEGRPAAVIEISRDITEHKRAEDALRASRDYLENLTNSMWDAVFSVKMPERVIEWVNDSFRLIGYEPSECIGKDTAFIYADKDDFLDFGNKLKDAIAAGKDVLHTDKLLKRKSGETFPAEITVTFHRENNEVVRVTSIIRDITERKQAEKSLRESELRYRSLTNDVLDTSSVGIFILDSDFQIVWVNHALERYFGLRRKEVIGKDKRQLIRERIKNIFEDPVYFTEKVFATYDDNTYIEHFECHIVPGSEREERWLEHWSQPIVSGPYAGGRVEHYSDITERKKAERKLQERMNELETFYRATLGREERVIELKQEVNELLEQLGKNKKYKDYT